MAENTLKELPVVSIRLVEEPGLKLKRRTIQTAVDAVDFITDDLKLRDREVVGVLNLNVQGKVINYSMVSMGSLVSAELTPREVFKSAVLSNAAGIMLFHNHPSGSIEPSREDYLATMRLAEAGRTIGINLIDHIIVGGITGEFHSMHSEMEAGEDLVNMLERKCNDCTANVFIGEKVQSYESQKKMGFREQIANQFVEALEKDPKNWKQGWSCPFGHPTNAVTGSNYNGINTFALSFEAHKRGYKDTRWATFKQIQDKGWKLQKGARGARVEYYFPFDRRLNRAMKWEEYNKLSEEEKQGTYFNPKTKRTEKKYLIQEKVFTVFNAECIEGIPPIVYESRDIKPSKAVKMVADGMGVNIVYDSTSGSAYYVPGSDQVTLPRPDSFYSDYDFAATAMHELAHATGHNSRLNRDQDASFGTEGYAKEELVAEIASCFMGEFVEAPMTEEHFHNHEAYIQSWAKKIKENKNYLFSAIKQADAAADYMIEHGHLYDLTETVEKKVEKKIEDDLLF